MSYHIKFCRSRSNRLDVGSRSQKFTEKSRPLGTGAWLTPRNMFALTGITVPYSVILGHTERA